MSAPCKDQDEATPAVEPLCKLYSPQGGPSGIFTSKAGDYAASRPDYPAAVFGALKIYCPPQPGKWVLDVGAGTGLFTRGLLEHGYSVLASEPNPSMRAIADAQLGARPGYRSVGSPAEQLEIPDHSMAMVTAAQSFHWFQVERAKAEFLRVLVPEGLVALIWNDREITDSLHILLDEVFARFGGAARAALLAQENRPYLRAFFGAANPYRFVWPHEHVLDEEGLIKLVFSRSYMPDRTSEEGAQAAAFVSEIFRQHESGGKVVVHYQTTLVLGRPQ